LSRTWRARSKAVLVCGAVLALTSCGLHVSPALRAQGIRGAMGQGLVANGAASPAAGVLPPGSSGPAGGPSQAPGGGAGPVVPGQGGTQPTQGPVTTPQGGNGGATDIGVTGNSVTFGSVATLSGPVPGLFQGTVYGARAYFAYANSLGGVYGRQVQLTAADDQLNCGTNKARHLDLAPKVFGFAASLSLYDYCSDAIFQGNKQLSDVSLAFSASTGSLQNNFSINPLVPGYRLGSLLYYKKKFPTAVQHMASLYGNVGAAPQIWANVRKAAESVGYHVDYERGYTAGESDFTTDIVQMRRKGVQMLYFISADVPTIIHVLQAANQQQWHPALVAVGAGDAVYDPAFIKAAGSLANGVYGDQGSALFFNPEDARAIPGVALYQQWMTKIGEADHMDLYSAWGWGQALLTVQALRATGPHLTRTAFLQALKGIHTFEAGGMFARTDPASKAPATCYAVLRVDNLRFHRLDTPADAFRCDAPYYYIRS
jgi:ABC-type branched-subunit amino acid transport system substrate-binding protein